MVMFGDASGVHVARDKADPVSPFARVILSGQDAELSLDLGEGRDVRDGEVGADD